MQLLIGLAAIQASTDVAAVPIPYEQFQLGNGLRVIVHEDRKAPIVSVHVVYQVGSRDEPEGRSGFAHLYEHLMYRGSENFRGNVLQELENLGSSHQNAVTTFDYTHYFETVPTPALERVLWMESDRMGYLLGAITQEALDAERAVIANERGQRYGLSDGMAHTRVTEALFPSGHPYHHMPIGSAADLDRATLLDVHDWFKRYYGASNAVVVLSGDIDEPAARALMEKYFSDVPAGSPQHRVKSWIPERTLSVRMHEYADVQHTMVSRAWTVPGQPSREQAALEVVAALLDDGVHSRCRQELSASALGCRVQMQTYELASIFKVDLIVRPGVTVVAAEDALDAAIGKFINQGPTESELARFKRSFFDSQMIDNLVSVTAKGEVLAKGAIAADDPALYLRNLTWIEQATADSLRDLAAKWLSRGYVQTTVHPQGARGTPVGTGVRSHPMPKVQWNLSLDLPDMEQAVLPNGVRVVLAQRHEVPKILIGAYFHGAGYGADHAFKAFTATATIGLLNRAPKNMDSAQFAATKERLHIDVETSVAYDNAWLVCEFPSRNIDASMKLWADLITNPGFREEDLAAAGDQIRGQIRHKTVDPVSVATRLLSQTLYGPAHPAMVRLAREDQVEALTPTDLRAFHDKQIRPDTTTLLVVGDITMPEILGQLKIVIAEWRAQGTPVAVAPLAGASVPANREPRVILVDRPNFEQTVVMAGRLVPPTTEDDAATFNAINYVFGGSAGSRLSDKLRHQRGWAYSVGSDVEQSSGPRIWKLTALVQSDKTAEAILEILKEVTELTGSRPVTSVELAGYIKKSVMALPAQFEQPLQLFHAMALSLTYGWEYDRAEGAAGRLSALTLGEINRVAREYVRPQALTWVVVGDLKRFESDLRKLNIGGVQVWAETDELTN